MFSNVRGFSFAFHAASEGVGGRDSMRSQRAAPKSRAADVAKHDRATNPPCYPATIIALPTLRRVGHLHAANGAETSSLALRLTSSPRQGFVSGITPAHACRATCRTDNPQGELLSVPKISQAYPGTQEEARTRLPLLPCLYSRSCSDKITIPDPICSQRAAPKSRAADIGEHDRATNPPAALPGSVLEGLFQYARLSRSPLALFFPLSHREHTQPCQTKAPAEAP